LSVDDEGCSINFGGLVAITHGEESISWRIEDTVAIASMKPRAYGAVADDEEWECCRGKQFEITVICHVVTIVT
jgi:hypothetical protein